MEMDENQEREGDPPTPGPPSPSSEVDVMKKALGNHLILEKIFNQCLPGLLHKFRLVSKQWYEESLAPFRSSAWISFRSTTDGVEKLRRFLNFVDEEVNECDSKPYRQFRLVGYEFSQVNQRPIINRFLETCSSRITSLELVNCSFDGVEAFRLVLFNTCPHLHTLKVSGPILKNEKPDGQWTAYVEPAYGEMFSLRRLTLDLGWRPFPISWLELFSHFPALTSLKMDNIMGENGSEILELLRAMLVIRLRNNRKLTLRSLDLLTEPRSRVLALPSTFSNLLRELRWPLETLRMNFGTNTEADVVGDILEMHAGTLSSLTACVQSQPLCSTGYSRFPFQVQLDNLREFRTTGSFLKNFHFLRFTPNLHEFHICSEFSYTRSTGIVNRSQYWMMANVRLVHLTELKIELIVGVEDVHRLVRWMPNVESLSMHLNDCQFGVVCQRWRGLQRLRVLGGKLTDEGVTGRGPDPDEEEGGERVRPNITWLQGLRSLEINDEGSLSKLTSDSTLHGFSHLERLQSIAVPPELMSAEAKDALLKRNPDCEIIRTVWDGNTRCWLPVAE